MKMKLFVACALTACGAIGGLALASDTPSGGGYSVRPITWDQFKDSCRHPGQYQAQRPPQNIKIVCRDDRFSWLLSPKAKQTTLPQSRTIGTELFSDKYHVGAGNESVCTDDFKAGCPAYDQIELTLNLEQSVTCDDVQDFKGSLTDYCEGILDNAYAKNPGAYSSQPTGKTVDFCSHDDDGSGGNDGNASQLPPVPSQKGNITGLFAPMS